MMEERTYENQQLLKGMVWIGAVVAAVVIALRVWLLPAFVDLQTGMFTSNYWVIALMLAALVALAVLSYLAGPVRREIVGTSSVALSLTLMLTGVAMAIDGIWKVLGLYEVVNYRDATAGTGRMLPLLEYGFCVLGGLALLRFGLTLLSEGATRRGIAQWSILAPVLWAWFRLINYEMSYASMVRIEDNFFGFMMLILELLFLFRLARYASGIGRVGAASMLFHAMATAIFALSGPLTRVGMYLLQDNRAYSTYHLAGPLDLVIGVLALVVGIALLSGEEVAQPTVAEESGPSDTISEDVSATSAAAGLLLEEVEEDEGEEV